VDFSARRLLLVEDNEINRDIATLILEDAGFSLETAENGKVAVEKVRASRPGYYDAILMDVQMPVMNGYEATRAIRALDDPGLSRIPILAVTANAFSEDVQNAREAGMDGHLSKPLDVPKVLQTLSELFGRQRRA
jgi:CheY-like chemotaxis protein